MTVRQSEREGPAEEAWLPVRERTLPTGGGAWAESQYWRECAYLECLGVACSPNTAWWTVGGHYIPKPGHELRTKGCLFLCFAHEGEITMSILIIFPKIPC